jgi:hypothetical protein
MLLVYKDLPGLTAPSLKVVEIGVASNTSSPHLPFHPFRLHFSPITLHRPALSSQSRQSWLTYTQSGLALQHQWILHFIISLGFSPSSAFFSPYSYTIPPFSPPPPPSPLISVLPLSHPMYHLVLSFPSLSYFTCLWRSFVSLIHDRITNAYQPCIIVSLPIHVPWFYPAVVLSWLALEATLTQRYLHEQAREASSIVLHSSCEGKTSRIYRTRLDRDNCSSYHK